MGYAREFGIRNAGINSIRKNYVYDDVKDNPRIIYVEFSDNGCMSFGELFDGLYHVMINFKPSDIEFIRKCILEFDMKEFEVFNQPEKKEEEDETQL